jgi:hypothetical protein
MSQQDDERIARKLLDLGARSDRVQIRNGITYIDGYALGNGTVEIRSQVVRDRRRREAPVIEGYAAAILYEVVNGTNSEIWLQDDGAEPVLITTLPQRIDLGWTSSLSISASPPDNNQDFRLVGHFVSPGYHMPAAMVPLDIERDTVLRSNTSSPLEITISPPTRYTLDVSLSDNGSSTLGGMAAAFSRLTGVSGGFLLEAVNHVDNVPLRDGHVDVQVFPVTTLYHEVFAGAANAVGPGSIATSSDLTVRSASNAVRAILQKRKSGTYVYIQSNPTRDVEFPPDIDNGEVWSFMQYWANGVIASTSVGGGQIEPDSLDITGGVLSDPFNKELSVSLSGQPIDRAVLNSFVNFLDSQKSISLTTSGNSLIKESEDSPSTVEATFSVGVIGNAGASMTAPIAAVTHNARQVLSVAIYPRG